MMKKLTISACIALLSVHLSSCSELKQPEIELTTELKYVEVPFSYDGVIYHLVHITNLSNAPIQISHLLINRGACQYSLHSGSWLLSRYSSTVTFKLNNCEIDQVREAMVYIDGEEYVYGIY